ncbi:pyridoxamine 5'-phosphate oxidase-domain-containing protein [Collybia nuda]|uniref:Pyridoxamine 5'-phosphate oxidase-domain-containing protein n=1 Tax=Collybia nuda TaxID=64659 RepID=A0A9P5YI06_9AGAR|nr:pyridoxamine 5'-phosphate oxidase-domain-containing protein [Collybia nuda]
MASIVPRWKTAITSALAEHEKSVVFQLATIDPTTPVPLVRSHIFRASLSPTSSPSLSLIVTTTDIRTPKVSQIVSNPHVQLAWWIDGTQEQFRITGLASVIPFPTHALYRHFIDNAKNALSGSALAGLNREGFDWEAQRQKMFKGMSGHMKASWCRPVPGSPLVGGEEEAKRWPVKLEEPREDSDEETKKNWETALGNFALVIVDPTDVDMVELGVVPNRRSRFWRTASGEWESEALVP